MKSLLQTIAEQLTESAEVAKQTELPPVELKPVVPGLIDQKIELAHMYNEFRLAEQRVANGTLNEMEPGARYIRDLNLRKIDIIREKFDSKFKDLLGIQDISEINDLDEAFDILEGKKPNNSKANLPKGDDEFKDLWDQEYGTEYHGGKEQREKDVAAAKAAFLKRFPSKPLKKEEVEQIDELKKSTVDSYLTKSTGSNLQARDAKTVARNAVSGKKKPNMTLVALAKVGRVPSFMKKHAKAKIAATNEEASVSYIEEKLTAADPANKWVSDFVHSENPKFAGKSKKERINMALGAYYAAKRGMKEEVEQIDELKKSTLASYIGKAAGRVASASRLQKDFERDGQYKLAGEFEQTAKKRRANIQKAANKLAKEEVEQIDEESLHPDIELHHSQSFSTHFTTPEGRAAAAEHKFKEGNLGKNVVHTKTSKVLGQVRKDAIGDTYGASTTGKYEQKTGFKTPEHAANWIMKQHMNKEEAEGKVAVTPKEKKLAAHHGNPKRITYGDVIKARIKSAKK